MDYETILESARREDGVELIAVFACELVYEWCEIYEAMSSRTTNIVRFQCGTYEYLYDYSSLEATGRVPDDPVMEARLVAVSGRSLFQEKARDDFRLKGWLGAMETTFGREWDKGHFIAHSIGGAVDPGRGECLREVAGLESGLVGGRKALSRDGSLLLKLRVGLRRVRCCGSGMSLSSSTWRPQPRILSGWFGSWHNESPCQFHVPPN
jgi:hypothetical protein